jgi:hypothetical protein
MKLPTILCALVVVFATGCSTSKAVKERGWIGGEYKLARNPRVFQSASAVHAFPNQLQQSAGVFIVCVPTNSPLARAGLRAGDLILELDHEPVEGLNAFWKRIDGCEPGAMLSVKFFRDSETIEREIIVGREFFRSVHTLGLGFMLSRQWDLWPNPEFSLIALGYGRSNERLELHSPEAEFVRAAQTGNDRSGNVADGMDSREGWHSWLGVVSLGAHNQIVSQEILDRHPQSEEVAQR